MGKKVELFYWMANMITSRLLYSETFSTVQCTVLRPRPILDQEIKYEILNHFLGRIMFPISSLFHALKSRVSLNYSRVTTF